MRGPHEDDAVDGKRGEDEEEGRAEKEHLHFGGGDDGDTFAAAASASTLVTNPLPLEAPLQATSSTQGHLGLINPGSDLTSLGKITSCGDAVLHVLPAFFHSFTCLDLLSFHFTCK